MPPTATSSWRRRLTIAIVLILLAGVLAGIGLVVTGAVVSLRAEERLQATFSSIRLVDQFVQDNGRWPSSWQELETMPFPSETPSPMNDHENIPRIDWPADSARLQRSVTIDFSPNLQAILDQDPMTFEAIQPSGLSYEYRDHGFVTALQQTLRDSLPPAE